MSRLIDRFLAAGCPPFQLSEMYLHPDAQASLGRAAAKLSPPDAANIGLDDRQLGQLLLRELNSRGTVRFEPDELKAAPVIAADNVADYCADLPLGTVLAEVVTTVAPPFYRFFIECVPSRPPTHRLSPLHAWGYLCRGLDLTDQRTTARPRLADHTLATILTALGVHNTDIVPTDLASTEVRWILQLSCVLELRKGHPMGPVAEYQYFLDEEGCLIGRPDGSLVSVESLIRHEPKVFAGCGEHILEMLDIQLLPALFALSLMHCKNVRVETVEPPAALSRKAQRRTGNPLTRYQVLEIGAMRRILDDQGKATTKGLGQALHICRGHFKTFTPEAPLFGRHVGRYFWHDVARGNPHHGAVTTDFQVQPPTTGTPDAEQR